MRELKYDSENVNRGNVRLEWIREDVEIVECFYGYDKFNDKIKIVALSLEDNKWYMTDAYQVGWKDPIWKIKSEDITTMYDDIDTVSEVKREVHEFIANEVDPIQEEIDSMNVVDDDVYSDYGDYTLGEDFSL